MNVPPIYWFVFWVALSIGVLAFGFYMAIIIHRGNMKALEILRSYAEKGMEPPPLVLETLSRHLGASDSAPAGRQAGARAGNFTGLLVAACISGGIAWWRLNQGGPQWVVYVFAMIALFWAVRAIFYLFSPRTASKS